MLYDESGNEIHENADIYRLIDAMALDILYLETEIVRLRKRLSALSPQSSYIDFLSDLAGYYAEHETYFDYVQRIHGGVDPLGEKHTANLNKILKNDIL